MSSRADIVVGIVIVVGLVALLLILASLLQWKRRNDPSIDISLVVVVGALIIIFSQILPVDI